MTVQTVALFKPYVFTPNQKIRILEGPRKGDWEVVAATERKVTLRCPVSGRQFEWNRFCYWVEDLHGAQWPLED